MKKDLILFAGQSNMQGQTGILPSPNEPVENAEEYLFLKDELTALKHPVGENVAFGGGAGKGELCDALESRTKEEYARLLRAFGESLKADLGLEKFFVIRVGRFAQDERDFPVLAAQEEVCTGGGYFCMLTRKTGELTQNPQYMSYEPWHYNNEAFSLLGKICGENAAQIFEGKEIALENEPYAEFAAWLKAQK